VLVPRATSLLLILTLALAGGACSRSPAAPAAAGPLAREPAAVTLAVPHVRGPVAIDAELDGKKMWEGEAGATQNFRDAAGRGMVPYTEAKARWGDGKLYFMLYAGDLDLEGQVRAPDGPVERDDAFRLEIGGGPEVRVVSVSVLGTVADALCRVSPAGRTCDPGWKSGAEVAVDRDGTLNRVGDNDEEWVVEMALPLASLGLPEASPGARLPIAFSRCEIGRGDRKGPCGGWGLHPRGELVLEP